MACRRDQAQAMRRARRPVLAALAAVSAACAGAFGCAAWLSPGQSARQAGVEGPEGSRRRLFGAAIATAASPLLGGEAAHAFREDRIFNSKKKYIPKIRKLYQKLMGFRTDLVMTVQMTGDKDAPAEGYKLRTRPAKYFDGDTSKFLGPVALPLDEGGWGCKSYGGNVAGPVVFVPRGRCDFSEKVEFAKEAGAQAVVIWDEKMNKLPPELQGKPGEKQWAKGIQEPGDEMSPDGGLLPWEHGVMTINTEKSVKMALATVGMVNRTEGFNVIYPMRAAGASAKVVSANIAFEGEYDEPGLNRYIKKDLPNILRFMKLFGAIQRPSKEGIKDPIVTTLTSDQNNFEKAVRAKDFAGATEAMKAWRSHMTPEGQWDAWEYF